MFILYKVNRKESRRKAVQGDTWAHFYAGNKNENSTLIK